MKRVAMLFAALLAFAGLAFAAVNINSATKEQLESLDGVGPVKAQAIIDYRQKNGPFKSLEDVKNVKGIGDATFEKMHKDISLTGTTVPVKTSDQVKAKAADAKAATKEAVADTKAAVKEKAADTKATVKEKAADTKAAVKETAADTKAAVKAKTSDKPAAEAKKEAADTKAAAKKEATATKAVAKKEAADTKAAAKKEAADAKKAAADKKKEDEKK